MSRSMQNGAKSAEDDATEREQSGMTALQALFISRSALELAHPRVPRILFSELQQEASTPPRTVAQSVIKDLSERFARELEAAKASGEVTRDAYAQAAGKLFTGVMQGLVLQSLPSRNAERIWAFTPEILKIILRSVEQPPRLTRGCRPGVF